MPKHPSIAGPLVAQVDPTAQRASRRSRLAPSARTSCATCLLAVATASCGGEFSCADEKTCAGHGVQEGSGASAGTGGEFSSGAGGMGGEGGVGGSGGVPPPRLFVDPVDGSDESNVACSERAPCRSLKHTLPLAKSGYFVELRPGTYGAAIGEDFSVPVPDGVTLEAVTGGSVTLRGGAARTETALTFAGSGTAGELTLDSFAQAIAASTGRVALEKLTVTGCATGLLVGDQADVTLTSSAISGTALGFALTDFARLSIDGGAISGTGASSCGVGTVGRVTGEAKLELSKVTVSGNGGGLYLGGSSTTNIANSTFSNNGNCEADYHIIMADAPSLTLTESVITGGWNGITAAGNVTMAGGQIYRIGGLAGEGIRVNGGSVSIDRTALVGSEDRSGAGLDVVSGAVDVRNAKFNQWYAGISLWPGASLLVRNTELTANQSGVFLFDQPSYCDLGTASAPGDNTIHGNARGLEVSRLSGDQTGFWFIQAAGNAWDPSVQGADAEGHMAAGSILSGPYTEAGTNFRIDSDLVAVHF